VALGVDAQPIESIRQKADAARQNRGFDRVLLAAGMHKLGESERCRLRAVNQEPARKSQRVANSEMAMEES
jgi:hypothetical protein